jgi:hypothetical protein
MPILPNSDNIQRKTPRASTSIPMLNYQAVDDSLGRAVQDIGDFAFNEKNRLDSIAVDDAKNQYLQKSLDLQNEYVQIKGKNAVNQDIVKDYTKKLNTFSESLSSNLKNKSQKNAWGRYYGTAKISFISGVMNHKLTESDAYASDVYKNTNSTRIQVAQSNWGDTETVDQSASDITNNIIKEKLRAGWSDERTEVELTDNLGSLWAGVATQYINAKQYGAARKLIDKHQEVIGVNNIAKLNNAIDSGEKVDLSYELATNAEKTYGTDVKNDNYFLQEKYDSINKSATSADVKKEAYEILERNYRVYNQNMTDNYNTRAGAMLSQWNVDPTLTLNDFQKTDDYKSLTPRQQNTFAGKLKYEMYQRDQQERSVSASERAVRNDQYTQEQREKAEQAEVFKKSSDALYNKLSDDDNALALMPDDTFQVQESLMDSTLYRTLSKQRKKAQEDLPTSKLVSNYLNAFCKKNNISAEDKQLYRTAITNNLGDEKELSVINKRIPEILQNTVLEKHWYKANEVKVKDTKLAPDGSLDKTEKYEVDKIYTDAQGRKAKYIGNGQWQIQ